MYMTNETWVVGYWALLNTWHAFRGLNWNWIFSKYWTQMWCYHLFFTLKMHMCIFERVVLQRLFALDSESHDIFYRKLPCEGILLLKTSHWDVVRGGRFKKAESPNLLCLSFENLHWHGISLYYQETDQFNSPCFRSAIGRKSVCWKISTSCGSHLPNWGEILKNGSFCLDPAELFCKCR